MPIQCNCTDCCVELTFPDNMAGRQVNCHVCDAQFVAPGAAGPVAVANGGSRTVQEQRISATPSPKRDAVMDVEPVESVEPVEPVRKPRAEREERVSASRPKPAKSQKPDESKMLSADVEIIDDAADVEAAEAVDEEGKPRKKKRKKKRKKAESFPAWVWWLVAGGVGIVGMFTFLLVLIIGLKQSALGYVVALAIMMPVSMVLMVVSMFITSALGGGVDFGDARVAIPKAAALLFVINAINVSPCGIGGYWITLPIWIFGLIVLFKLDVWEAVMMFLLNWGFGCVLRFVALGLLVSAATHMQEHPEQYRKKGPSSDDLIRIVELGGEFEYGKGADHPIIGIKLRNPKVKDFHMELVKSFPDLKSLDLSRSSVTDGGLQQLVDIPQLKEVIVAQTLVSRFGVTKLRQERPDMNVIFD
jgi:hypothetical protein